MTARSRTRSPRAGHGDALAAGTRQGTDFDSGNALGHWLVTADAIPPPYGLSITARVNGAKWSQSSTADMHWKFEDVIAHISRPETCARPT